MPRWRPLPEELDPEIREFTGQLRRLVDRAGLGVAAVADRTGYSRSSWERYLGGRLLPPRGAVHALAGITGTDLRHLETMWELAERAWSRSELRHDETIEAIRISQARTALAEQDGAGAGDAASAAQRGSPGSPGEGAGGEAGSPPGAASGGTGRPPRAMMMALAGAAGALVVIGAAAFVPGLSGGKEDAAATSSLSPSPSASHTSSTDSRARTGRGAHTPPDGAKCHGSGCAGKDPERMGCGGQHAKSAGSARAGRSVVEIRYSRLCATAWGRVTSGTRGELVRIRPGSGARPMSDRVGATHDAYTAMVAVTGPSDARACATSATGVTGCTPGSAPR